MVTVSIFDCETWFTPTSRARRQRQDRHDVFLRRVAPGDDRVVAVEINIDLATKAELARQIDAWLDRETRVRNQPPFVVGLKIIQVRPVAVDFAGNGMPGAVNELRAIAGRRGSIACTMRTGGPTVGIK